MRSLYFAIIGFTLAAYAPSLGSTGQLTPYRFGPRESELLTNGEVVVQVNQSEEGSKGTIRAAIVVDAPAEQIWNALTDCDHTPEFIPRLQSCKVLQHEKDMEIIEHQVNISWFLPSFTYTFRVSYDRFKRIDFKRIGGDLKEVEGSWVLEQEDNGRKTIIVYSVYLDPGFLVPQWLVRLVLRYDLPDLLLSIRRHVAETSH